MKVKLKSQSLLFKVVDSIASKKTTKKAEKKRSQSLLFKVVDSIRRRR